MNKATYSGLCFILIAFCLSSHVISAGSGGRGRSSSSNRLNRNYSNGYGNGYNQQPPVQQQPDPQTPKEYLDSKAGLSTFGIISIIFFVILGCLCFYYGIMCYPFLCRDEKKYRFMDVSSTITAATSRSMQSIDSKMEKSCV